MKFSTDAVTAARQSSILGFGVFQVLERYGFRKLSVGENVILQTTSVATATMPLAAGKFYPVHHPLHCATLR